MHVTNIAERRKQLNGDEISLQETVEIIGYFLKKQGFQVQQIKIITRQNHISGTHLWS